MKSKFVNKVMQVSLETIESALESYIKSSYDSVARIDIVTQSLTGYGKTFLVDIHFDYEEYKIRRKNYRIHQTTNPKRDVIRKWFYFKKPIGFTEHPYKWKEVENA